MTTLDNRPNTALLVVDVQTGVVADAHDRGTVVANISSLVDRARTEQIPVVWVQDSLDGRTGIRRLAARARAVAATPPSRWSTRTTATRSRQPSSSRCWPGSAIGRLIVVGAQTDMCIRSTLHGALARGYDATLVADAHTTEDLTAWGAPPPEQVISHTNMYWGAQTAPGHAGTVATADVSFTG